MVDIYLVENNKKSKTITIYLHQDTKGKFKIAHASTDDMETWGYTKENGKKIPVQYF
jgi:hypothetical protein